MGEEKYGAKVWANHLIKLIRLRQRQKNNYLKICVPKGHKKPSYFKHEWPDYICIRCGQKFVNPDYVAAPKPTFMKHLKDKDKPWVNLNNPKYWED